MPDKVRILTWEQIQDAVNIIYGRLILRFSKNNLPNPHLQIVTIANGGIIPAVMLAKLWGNCTLDIVPKGKQMICSNVKYSVLIDDICDTGKTITDVKSNLVGVDIPTYTIISKVSSYNKISYAPYFVDEDIWVVFPWEIVK